jgi:hypothetical protein
MPKIKRGEINFGRFYAGTLKHDPIAYVDFARGGILPDTFS